MATSHSRFLTFCIASIGAAACAAVHLATSAVDGGWATLRSGWAWAVSVVMDGLNLFSAPALQLHKTPEPRTQLTARERHDVGMWSWLRPLVARSWRAGAWA